MAKRKKKDEVIDGSKMPEPIVIPITPKKDPDIIPLELGRNVGNKSKIGVHGLKISFQEGLLREGIECQRAKGNLEAEVIIQIDDVAQGYTLDDFKERLGF